MEFPFIGPSYSLRSKNIDAQRSVNLYPTADETSEGKSSTQLVATPGIQTFATLSTLGCRGCFFASNNGRAFTVYGNQLYEVFSNGTFTVLGVLNTSNGRVGMDGNGLQLCVVDGPYGYIFVFATNTFVPITDPDFPGANTVAFVDGYFCFNHPDTGQWFISQLYDGTSFDGLDFATAEGNPDNIVAIAGVRRNVWELGQSTTEVSYNSGNPDFPFDRIQGAFMEYGCAGAGTASTLANTIFWVGSDKDGAFTVWMAEQYAPQRVSTFAIEYMISLYGANIINATSFTYQEEGHFFYVLNIPGMPSTLVYDVTLKEWHERCYLNTDFGVLERGRPEHHMFAFGKHLVGDYATGKLYQQSLDFTDDDGGVVKRLRTCQYIADDLEYIFHERLQIDVESGVGLPALTPVEDNDPQMVMRYSNDGANTWSNELFRSMGKQGEYNKRVLWNRLGKARQRVYEISVTSRCKVNILAGHILLSKGTA